MARLPETFGEDVGVIRNLAASMMLACLLVGCGATSEPDASQAQAKRAPRAGQPMNSLEVAARIAKVRAASVLGDQATVREEMGAMQDDFRRSMKLPDSSRPIDREAARAAAKRVPGVDTAVWVDRANLLALVNRNDERSMATIDAICDELDSLGDTLAVVVHLQSREARNGDELETISRNCQLAEGDRALLQADRQLDVIPKDIRAQHASQQRLGDDAPTARRRADEAAKLIEATTPEM